MKVNKMQINAGRSAQCLHCRPALATTTDCLNYGGQGQCSAPRLAGCWRRLNAYHVLFQGLSSDLSAAGCFTRTHPPARITSRHLPAMTPHLWGSMVMGWSFSLSTERDAFYFLIDTIDRLGSWIDAQVL
jgi:hypothetical protein